ncbi:MAG: branched-chain amino acid ABC transporter substrate-binding protein [Deltaproteobacteria bacterium]|nr:branched-chain amino acid ABC transporter substrate-binding protein [Deltaproteobacteria bacterium]
MKRLSVKVVLTALVVLAVVLSMSIGVSAARTVKIAFIGPLSGPNAAQGNGAKNCFDLAIRQANKSGKFPYKIEMMTLDDASDPAVAVSAALKAVSDRDVVAASGHWNSACALATIHTFHSFRVPFIVWGAISPRITEYNYPEVVRNCPTLVQENVPFAKWVIVDLGYKTFSIISDTTDYGEQNTKAFSALAKKHGARIVSVDSVSTGTTDFRPILTKIKGLDPSAIYFGGVVMEGALTRSQMAKIGLNKLFCAVSGLADDKFIEVAGKRAAEGTIITKPGFELDRLPGAIEFKKAYEAQNYREPMGAYGIYAYEAANIILEALKQVGPDDKVAIAKAIRNIRYEGILGTTTFDKNGQTELAPVTKLVAQDGKWVEWERSEYATGKRRLPKPY